MPARTASLWAVALVAVISLGACDVQSPAASSSAVRGYSPEAHGDLGNLTYRAVDRLVAAVPELAVGKSIVVSSIVDEQRVDRSSAFGNLIAEMARTRLVQKGVAVSEIRLRSAVLFDEKQGSLMLANDSGAVVPPPSAAAILTGTYAASDEMIYVSLKLVAVSDARIVGAVDFVVPRRGSELLLAPTT